MIVTSGKEDAIRAAFDAGNLEQAATQTIAMYGREMVGYLAKNFVSPSDSEDIFSDFTVRLWSTLAAFDWRCSMRTWCYRLMHSAFLNYVRAAHRQPRRNVPLSCAEARSEVVAELRSSTAPWVQTTNKDKLRRLRDRLSEKDQQLLILHTDQGLTFDQVAFILLAEKDPQPESIDRESQRLRRAYSRLRVRFREIAEQEGLLEPREPAQRDRKKNP